MKRRRINPDAWWYIERPFPWLLLAWPVLWLYATLREVFRPQVLWGGGPVFIGTEAPVSTLEVTYMPADQFDELVRTLGEPNPIYVKRGPAGEPVAIYLHPESGR